MLWHGLFSKREIRFRLQTKLLIGIILLEAVLLAAIMLVVEKQERESILHEFLKRGLSVTRNLAAVNSDFVTTYNYVKIDQNLEWVVQENGLLYAAVILFDGEVASYKGREDFKQVLTGALHARTLNIKEVLIQYDRLSGQEFCDIAVPVFLKTESWGTVRAGFLLNDMQQAIIETRRLLLKLGLIGLIVGWFASIFLARLITHPIDHLVESVKAIAQGDYDHPIKVESRDEIGYLSGRFTAMQATVKKQIHLLAETNRQLSASNASLQHEVTERRRTEELLRTAKEAAEAAKLAKSQFLANMSHEIRTPMYGVLGMTELLLETELSGRQRGYVEITRQSGQVLLDLINNILDVSKIEAGKLALSRVDFNPGEMIAEGVKLLAEQAQRKGLELACWIAPEVPTALRGDPGRLRQIVINLLSNAVKFTDSGEVVVGVGVAAQEPDWVMLRFTVRDTGIGIAPAEQGYIFDSFSQADSSTTRRYGGSGLGLAICKQLVTLMQGNIGVESEPGRGSTFWFTARLFKQPDCRQPPASYPLQDLRALVAVVNRTVGEILCQQMRDWRVQADAAGSGRAALDRLRRASTGEAPYDLVILDTDGVDGNALVRGIQADPALKSLRLIALASLSRVFNSDQVRQHGIAACLIKPVLPAELYRMLIQAMAGAAPTPSFQAPSGNGASRTEFNLHILLAEDNPINQKVTTAMLRKLGCRVDVVEDGREAVERLALPTHPYDLILMDCQMPRMDGYEATRLIREHEARLNGKSVHLPIIALTANAMPRDSEICRRAGMDDYLSKPMTLEQLQTLLEKWSAGIAGRSAAAGQLPKLH